MKPSNQIGRVLYVDGYRYGLIIGINGGFFVYLSGEETFWSSGQTFAPRYWGAINWMKIDGYKNVQYKDF
jgi:hypothetical protein